MYLDSMLPFSEGDWIPRDTSWAPDPVIHGVVTPIYKWPSKEVTEVTTYLQKLQPHL